MKTLKIGSLMMLGAGLGAIGCHSEPPVMQPASRTEPASTPPPSYGTSEMGAPQQQAPATAEMPSTEATPAQGSEAAPTWGSSGTRGPAALTPDAQAAAQKIVTARCDREATCNNIGQARKYPTREACDLALNAEIAEALASHNCTTVDGSQVAACVTELRKESCNSGLGAVDHVVECRIKALCSD